MLTKYTSVEVKEAILKAAPEHCLIKVSARKPGWGIYNGVPLPDGNWRPVGFLVANKESGFDEYARDFDNYWWHRHFDWPDVFEDEYGLHFRNDADNHLYFQGPDRYLQWAEMFISLYSRCEAFLSRRMIPCKCDPSLTASMKWGNPGYGDEMIESSTQTKAQFAVQGIERDSTQYYCFGNNTGGRAYSLHYGEDYAPKTIEGNVYPEPIPSGINPYLRPDFNRPLVYGYGPDDDDNTMFPHWFTINHPPHDIYYSEHEVERPRQFNYSPDETLGIMWMHPQGHPPPSQPAPVDLLAPT
jgi:hypothetical protein